MKKFLSVIAVCLISVFALSLFACGDKTVSYKDGTYTGRSADYQADESGVGAGYAIVKIEIKDNKIVDCECTFYELDGTVKDENYGSDLSRENYVKAQKAAQSAAKYAEMLLKSGSLKDIGIITGATICYNEFTEATQNALNQAKE